MGLKENIKNRRLNLKLTLEDVSKKLSISKPTLHRYESGVILNIPSDKIEKLAEILETTPAELMGWKGKDVAIKPQFTKEEQSLLDKYNSLDYVGKHTVSTVLQMEFDRCN